MVVGQADAGRVAGQVAEGPAPQIPLVQIIEHRLVQRRADRGRGAALVDLVAGEEVEVGIVLRQVGDHVGVREPRPLGPGEGPPAAGGAAELLAAAQGGQDDRVRLDRVMLDRAGPVLGLVAVAEGVGQPEGHVAGRVPALDPERRREAGDDDLGLGDRLPVPPCSTWSATVLPSPRPIGMSLRGELEDPLAVGVLRAEDRPEGAAGVGLDLVAGDGPVSEPEAAGIRAGAGVRDRARRCRPVATGRPAARFAVPDEFRRSGRPSLRTSACRFAASARRSRSSTRSAVRAGSWTLTSTRAVGLGLSRRSGGTGSRRRRRREQAATGPRAAMDQGRGAVVHLSPPTPTRKPVAASRAIRPRPAMARSGRHPGSSPRRPRR